jgi:hypothetical protein
MNETFNLIANAIDSNNIITDLTNIEPNEENLEIILKCLKQIPNTIGHIVLTKSEHKSNNKIIEIEDFLMKNNVNQQIYPNDYIHSLLSLHCFITPGVEEGIQNSNRDLKFKILNEQNWQIEQAFYISAEYQSILYVCHKKRHLVLAFQSIKLKSNDNSLLNIQDPKQIELQSYYTYLHTKKVIELSQTDQFLHYSVSFTGYGVAGCLAEQAVFYSQTHFLHNYTKAVTFESIGSSYLFGKQLDLDVVTYLSEPNFVNTSNLHIGTLYRLFIENNTQDEDTIIKDDRFYLNGIRSLLPDALISIIDQFDVKTGKPKYFKQIIQWPLDSRSPIGSSMKSIDLAKKLDKKTILLIKSLCAELSSHINDFASILNAIKQSCVDMNSNFTQNKFTFKSSDLFQDSLLMKNHNGIDYLLFRLKEKCDINDFLMSNKKKHSSDFFSKQLCNLKELYKIKSENKSHVYFIK